MLYDKYIKKLKTCPFCYLRKPEILKQNKFAVLILSRAPYTKDHLLVVPKKHVLRINKLSKKQKDGVEKLIYYTMKKLHKKYKNVTLLYREGNKKEVGKSINHAHYHLIPNLQIGAKERFWKNRKIFSEEIYVKKARDVKKRLEI